MSTRPPNLDPLGFPPAVQGYKPPRPYTKPGIGLALLPKGPKPPLDEETKEMILRRLEEARKNEEKFPPGFI